MSAPIIEVLWPDRCQEHPLVGAKARVLASLADRFCVPPFFCIPADLLIGWGDSPPTPESVVALESAYDALVGDTSVGVAVRSSAIDEDGEHSSFAGQYTTVLNLSSFSEVLDAITRCLGDALSESIARYRGEEVSDATPHMAVIVQQQVRADASAVAFSADPTTGERGKIVINAAWGLGEGVVSGAITPDTFVVSRADASVSASLSDKASMNVAVDGGTATLPVPPTLRRYPSLTGEQVSQIAELADALETIHGHPVDIECCVRGDTLYLLQCRPITALITSTQTRSP